MEEIFRRRSVRHFTDMPVSEEDTLLLLKAAMQAPSAGNEQPWEFITIRDRGMMLKIVETQPYANALRESTLAIIVCGDTKKQKYPYDFWVQDCTAALQNILLEAVHLNLGAVWLGVYPIEERIANLSGKLGLPVNILPLGIVAVGHPVETPHPVDRFDAQRVHTEKW